LLPAPRSLFSLALVNWQEYAKLFNRFHKIQWKGGTWAIEKKHLLWSWLQLGHMGGYVTSYLFNSNNFAISVALMEVCALLSAILFAAV